MTKPTVHFIRSALILALWGALLAQPGARAAGTYYIDFSSGADTNNGLSTNTAWQCCPGMKNYAGNYTPAPGDTFVFRGGVSWPPACYIWYLNWSGLPGQPISYVSQTNWFVGSAWTNPLFDDLGGGNYEIYAMNQGNLVFDSLGFYRTGAPFAPRDGRAMTLINISNLTIARCVFEIEDSHTIVCASDASQLIQNVVICSNDFSHCSTAIDMGINVIGKPFQNVSIFANNFHDFHDQICKGNHSQGVHLWGPDDANHLPTAVAETNVLVYDNHCFGDWSSGDTNTSCTAQFYFEDGICGLKFFNNVLSFDNTIATNNIGNYGFFIGCGLVFFLYNTNVQCYNNTIYGGGLLSPNYGSHAGIEFQLTSNFAPNSISVSNNIIMGNNYGIIAIGGTNGVQWSCDYNLYQSNIVELFAGSYANTNGVTGFYEAGDLPSWQALASLDTHSLVGDPGFINSTTPPFNLALSSNSIALNAGINCGAAGQLDYLGNSRPTSMTGWTIGAYQAPSGAVVLPQPVVTLPAPSNLHVVLQ